MKKEEFLEKLKSQEIECKQIICKNEDRVLPNIYYKLNDKFLWKILFPIFNNLEVYLDLNKNYEIKNVISEKIITVNYSWDEKFIIKDGR